MPLVMFNSSILVPCSSFTSTYSMSSQKADPFDQTKYRYLFLRGHLHHMFFGWRRSFIRGFEDCLAGTLDKNLQDVSKARIRPLGSQSSSGRAERSGGDTPHPQKQKRLTLRLLPDQLVIHRGLCFWWQVEGSAQVDRRKRERIPPVEYYAAPTPHSSVELNCTSTTLCSRHIWWRDNTSRCQFLGNKRFCEQEDWLERMLQDANKILRSVW